ncbi:MAG: ABC transporter ATP-binding protein [Saprospiraceae bacterium]|nr:ABC transporter ATP-binding protein [Saprospiraceae bacterium]
MSLTQLFNKLFPFIKPYSSLIFYTLLLTVIGSFAAQVNAFILKYTVDRIGEILNGGTVLLHSVELLLIISAILLGKEVIYAATQFGQKFYGEKLRIYIARDFAQTIVEKILTYRMAFYTSSENESGKLQTRIDLGVSSLTRLVQNFFIDILPLFANALVALAVMFFANFYVGLVGLFIVPLYFYVSQLQAGRLSGFRRSMRKYRETKSSNIINLIESVLVIKSFVNEDVEAEKHRRIQYEMTENQMKTRKISFLFDSIKGFIEQIGVIIIIILTAYFVLHGQMTVGAILFHIMLFNNVSAPIRQLHRIYDEVNDALIYSEGFFDVLEAENETESSGTFVAPKIHGLIEMKDVDFEYPNGTKALHKVNLTIRPNEITALIGLSGAGKSTVINLLDKFYEPLQGQILLDGVDLQAYDTAFLRKNIGLVLQKNHIFKGTIMDNIRYGNNQKTDDDVMEAAKNAYLHDQIMSLPKAYKTEAHMLSGGQQQRIAIARMFLKNPPIIFLDEPTANLDAIATEQIKKSLDAIKKDRTVIIVSHSISQIIDATNIIVMEKGTVVEMGDHDTLYSLNGAYFRIFNAMTSSINFNKIRQSLAE